MAKKRYIVVSYELPLIYSRIMPPFSSIMLASIEETEADECDSQDRIDSAGNVVRAAVADVYGFLSSWLLAAFDTLVEVRGNVSPITALTFAISAVVIASPD